MKYNILMVRHHIALPFPIIGFLLLLLSPFDLIAQGMRMEKGEPASCVIRINNEKAATKLKTAPLPVKMYEVSPNQVGLFKQVSNIKPLEKISLELSYPSAKVGEKIVVTVLDGGKLDNGKGVKVMNLNQLRKCPFGFSVTENMGLYRLLVRKGNDVKVVQLWVGEKPVTAKK